MYGSLLWRQLLRLHIALPGAPLTLKVMSYPHGVANGAYTMPFNFSGHPAVVVPIGQIQNGLSIGMQIVSKRWREMELLATAQEINKVVSSLQHLPGY